MTTTTMQRHDAASAVTMTTVTTTIPTRPHTDMTQRHDHCAEDNGGDYD
jgi:hypothetical protein